MLGKGVSELLQRQFHSMNEFQFSFMQKSKRILAGTNLGKAFFHSSKFSLIFPLFVKLFLIFPKMENTFNKIVPDLWIDKWLTGAPN